MWEDGDLADRSGSDSEPAETFDPRPIPSLDEFDSDDEEFNASNEVMAERQKEIEDVWSTAALIADFAQQVPSDWTSLEEQLGIRWIQTSTLNRYDVRGYMEYEIPCLIYPRYRTNHKPLKPSGFKRIRLRSSGLKKDSLPVSDNGNKTFPGIFGWHLVRPNNRRVVLTTNERDAMAVYESCQELALALPHIPQGEKQKQIDFQVLPYLEDFDVVYIWFPPWHQDIAREYSTMLAGAQCIVVNDQIRPIDYLQKGAKYRIRKILFSTDNTTVKRVDTKTSIIAPPPVVVPAFNRSLGPKFSTSADYREAVRDELLGHRVRGKGRTQWQRFRVLNEFLYGFRLGELSIFTGPVGIGKTTFVCEYAVDLMKQGVRTLFCSFEMSDLNILKWMVVQFAEKPLWKTENRPSVDVWLDRFDRMEGGPLMMMNTQEFKGKHPLKVADAIRSQAELSMVEHVIIDTVQLLIGSTNGEGKSAVERAYQQDQFVSLMRRMATECRVHVTLVINPRRDDETQSKVGDKPAHDADNIFLINRKRQADGKFGKFLYILKNRYGQEKVENDRMEMQFLKETYCHRLVDRQPWKKQD